MTMAHTLSPKVLPREDFSSDDAFSLLLFRGTIEEHELAF